MTRTHVITGVAGQDGILLARLLLATGDRVVGTVPDGPGPLGPLLAGVEVVTHDLRDTDGFADLIAHVQPETVHNLAALSSVGDSWNDRETTTAVNRTAVERILEVLIGLGERAPVFIQASTSEIYGHGDGRDPVDEETPINPVSPYGEAKAAAHRAVAAAREHGLRATNLILFGHSSPLHAPGFVLPTIARQAAELSSGRRSSITLRDPRVSRDWGSARDVVRAFALAADGAPGDYVIGTGHLHSLEQVARWAAAAAGVDPDGTCVTPSGATARPRDVHGLRAASARAARDLDWSPRIALADEIGAMVASELLRAGSANDITRLVPGYLAGER